MADNLETIMGKVCGTFNKYASKDGKASTLSKSELAELAVAEFPTLCSSGKKDEILKNVFGKMDMDADGQVDFKEFCIFLCCLMMFLKDAGC